MFETGDVVLAALGLVAIEAAALMVFHHRTKRGIPVLPMLANLAAGGCLMLAIRSALLDHGWTVIGPFMAMALLAHLVDVGCRLIARAAGTGSERGERTAPGRELS